MALLMVSVDVDRIIRMPVVDVDGVYYDAFGGCGRGFSTRGCV